MAFDSKLPGALSMRSLKDHIGAELGVTEWLLIDQQRIDLFAAATNDPDPMHIDPAWAAQNSPYQTTIAFGFLTLSMLTFFNHRLINWDDDSSGHGINYGFNRVRFVAPVPVGSRIRCRMRVKESSQRNENETLNVFDVTVEIEGETKPALVAEWLGMWVQGAAPADL